MECLPLLAIGFLVMCVALSLNMTIIFYIFCQIVNGEVSTNLATDDEDTRQIVAIWNPLNLNVVAVEDFLWRKTLWVVWIHKQHIVGSLRDKTGI